MISLIGSKNRTILIFYALKKGKTSQYEASLFIFINNKKQY